MGPESSVYAYLEGATDVVVNFAQLTQSGEISLWGRGARKRIFSGKTLKGKYVLGGRKGGMPQMVLEYVLKQNGIDPEKIWRSTRASTSVPRPRLSPVGRGIIPLNSSTSATALEEQGDGYVIASLGEDSGYVPYTAFSARSSYMKEHPEVIQAFTDALQKGMDFCTGAHSGRNRRDHCSPNFLRPISPPSPPL